MNQQNFKEQDINQNVDTISIPSVQSSKYPSLLNTQRHPRLFHQLNIYNKKTSKQKQCSQSKNFQKKFDKKKDMQSFSFKPKINEKGKQRSIREFLESQYKFAKKIAQKKQNLKLNLEGQKIQQTFYPKTNKNSNYTRNGPVHQRLYNLRSKQNSFYLPKSDFKPKIAQRSKKIIRDVSISQHLYNDALRRQQKSQPKFDKINQERSSYTPLNQKYATQKFIKEFDSVVKELNLIQSPELITFQDFVTLLKRLNFVTCTSEKMNQTDKTQLEIAFKYISSQQISLKKICIFLMAILGIYNINTRILNVQSQINLSQEQKFTIDPNQAKKLHQKFQTFTRNRLFAQNTKPVKIPQNYTFKPQINFQNNALAQNYRNKVLQQTNVLISNNEIDFQIPKDGLINHIDLLHLNSLTNQADIKKKRVLKDEEQLKECTFKPHIRQGKKEINYSNLYQTEPKNKFEQLYNLSKIYGKKLKQKSTQEIEFEKNKKQCTFVPNIKYKQHTMKSLNKTQKFKIRNLEMNNNFIIDYNQLSKQIQNGSLSVETMRINENIQDCNNHSVLSQLPYLVIDINLGNQIQQITIYKDQIDEPQKIAEQFSMKHSLDAENKNILIELLRSQIKNMLNENEED